MATGKKTTKDTKPKKMGRPSVFTEAVAKTICEKLCSGKSLRTICDGDDMPGQTTVFRWLASNDEFRKQYAHAREVQADTLADETLDIADDGRNDWMEKLGKEGEAVGWQVNGEAVARSRLRVDQRKWYASKLAPKKYGEKLAIGGADDLPAIKQDHKYALTTDALLAIAAQALNK